MPCLHDDLLTDTSLRSSDSKRELIDQLTQNLCYICGELTYEDRLDILNPRTKKWWEEHQQNDDRRVREEMLSVAHHHDSPESLSRLFIKMAEEVHPVSRYHKAWFAKLAREEWAKKAEIQKQRRLRREYMEGLK